MELRGKKVVILGERDGVPAHTIEQAIENLGAEVVYATTQCFVWTAAGAVDLEVQGRVKQLAEEYGKNDLIVLLGAPNVDAARVQFETMTRGDPTYAGPLGGIELDLPVYHVFEPEVKAIIDPNRYSDLIETLELGLEADAIVEAIQQSRAGENQ
jgi:glycine/sarcosine/betaine reductase complex component A